MCFGTSPLGDGPSPLSLSVSSFKVAMVVAGKGLGRFLLDVLGFFPLPFRRDDPSEESTVIGWSLVLLGDEFSDLLAIFVFEGGCFGFVFGFAFRIGCAFGVGLDQPVPN